MKATESLCPSVGRSVGEQLVSPSQFFLEDMIEACNYQMDGNNQYSRMESLADRRGPSIDEQLDESFNLLRSGDTRERLSDEKLTVKQMCARYYG